MPHAWGFSSGLQLVQEDLRFNLQISVPHIHIWLHPLGHRMQAASASRILCQRLGACNILGTNAVSYESYETSTFALLAYQECIVCCGPFRKEHWRNPWLYNGVVAVIHCGYDGSKAKFQVGHIHAVCLRVFVGKPIGDWEIPGLEAS